MCSCACWRAVLQSREALLRLLRNREVLLLLLEGRKALLRLLRNRQVLSRFGARGGGELTRRR